MKLALRHMHGVWQQYWLAKPAIYGWQPFRSVGDRTGLHISFHWAALAKAYKQLWKDFVVTILCAVHVADAFGVSLAPYNNESDVNALIEAFAGAGGAGSGSRVGLTG